MATREEIVRAILEKPAKNKVMLKYIIPILTLSITNSVLAEEQNPPEQNTPPTVPSPQPAQQNVIITQSAPIQNYDVVVLNDGSIIRGSISEVLREDGVIIILTITQNVRRYH